MKEVLKKLKKHWITVWLIAVSLILGSFAAYAIYTEVSTVKRVVTTKSAPKELFSSNCMYADLYERRIPSREFNVNVNNFDLNSPDIPNSSDIQYILKAQLHVKYNGTIMTFSELRRDLGSDTETYDKIVAEADNLYSIGKSQDNNVSGIIAPLVMNTFNSTNNFEVVFGSSSSYETLPGGVISTDRYKVEVPSRDFDRTEPKFYVYVQADPVDSGLSLLRTHLYGSKNVVTTAAWSGTLAEKNTTTTDYDFYNYIISGSGSGNLDIMWDGKMFEIDDFFLDSSLSGVTFYNDNNTPVPITEGTYDGWQKVTIVVDSVNSKSRYELQLYKKKANMSYTGNNNAANYIHCELQ